MSSEGRVASPIKDVDTWHGLQPELAELRGWVEATLAYTLKEDIVCWVCWVCSCMQH